MHVFSRRFWRCWAICGALLSFSASASASEDLIEGIFWQPDNATHRPDGNWDLLGARTLVAQWLAVDDQSWVGNNVLSRWDNQIDLSRLAQQPWAQNIIAGLPGYYAEKVARANVHRLAKSGEYFAAEISVPNLRAYYFPVEVDPTWNGIADYTEALEGLPRPLWVSAYSHLPSADENVAWIKQWLPEDVGLFFQDGVGVGTRTATQAEAIIEGLEDQFGIERTAIVLEAFRTQADGSFRPATAPEVIEQLIAYQGHRIFVFDGPHYLDATTVIAIKMWRDVVEQLSPALAFH